MEAPRTGFPADSNLLIVDCSLLPPESSFSPCAWEATAECPKHMNTSPQTPPAPGSAGLRGHGKNQGLVPGDVWPRMILGKTNLCHLH